MFRLMRARVLALAALPVCVAAANQPPLATLTVHVIQVSAKGGNVRIALYNDKNYSLDKADPVTDSVVPAKSPETVVTMASLKPGTYAIKLFQDFNKNGEFDMNWLGLPAEKYGFSNDARPTFSEPPFDATKFVLKPGANSITIKLR